MQRSRWTAQTISDQMNKWSVLATWSSLKGFKVAAVSDFKKKAGWEHVQQKLYWKRNYWFCFVLFWFFCMRHGGGGGGGAEGGEISK